MISRVGSILVTQFNYSFLFSRINLKLFTSNVRHLVQCLVNIHITWLSILSTDGACICLYKRMLS